VNILLVLIPISLLLLGIAIAAFAWAVRRGQFDDLESAALDILCEDQPAMREQSRSQYGDDDVD
jgi:cbb3-type cytochrome oxidase maturation protein